MKVWIVGVSDYEGNYIVAVCATKEIAEKKLFEERDRLVKEWQELDEYNSKRIEEFCRKEKKKSWIDNMYKDMINALQGNDYENWNNYPHNCPYLYKTEVLADFHKEG